MFIYKFGLIGVCLSALTMQLPTLAKAAAQANDKAYALRADAYGRLGEHTTEINTLTAGLSQYPESQLLLTRRANAMHANWQLKAAIKDCTRLAPASEVQRIAVCSHSTLGQYDRAEKLLDTMIAANSKAFDLLAWRAYCKDRQSVQSACSDWKAAWEMANNDEKVILKRVYPTIDFGGTYSPIIDANRMKITSIPYYLRDGGQIAVPVEINDKMYDLALDTGCAQTTLWKSAKRKQDGMTIHSFVFGETFKDLAVNVEKCNVEPKDICGLLGNNILENFVVTIDFEREHVTLSSRYEASTTKKSICVPMLLHEHQPHCRVRLDDKIEYVALLDTDARSMVPDNLIRQLLPKNLMYAAHIQGPWLGKIKSKSVHLKSISIGSETMKAPRFDVFKAAEAPHASSLLVLGLDFLSRFSRVTFDYPRRMMIFEPYSTSP